MKSLFIWIMSVLSISSFAQSDFYYYKNEKIPLQLNTQNLYVLTSLNSKDAMDKKLEGKASVVTFEKDIYQQRLIKDHKNSSDKLINPNNYYALVHYNNPLSENELNKEILRLKADPSIIGISNGYNNIDNDLVYITNYVWVGLKSENDITKLSQTLTSINYSIVGQNPFMPEWVMIVPNDKQAINPILAAQRLYETGKFNTAEPDLLGGAKINCTNDTYFAQQWGLSNTGQNGGTVGMDTRVCTAWNYTTGSNAVDIAIIDAGVDLTHPDLVNNMQNNGYNAMTGTSPSVVYGSHGTACAGIAAASGNNNLGVAGVAYNADWFSVSINFPTATWAMFSDAVNWSRTNGAEVISNSWHWNNPSALFEQALTNAVTLGRGGLGCVVLFASGNGNNSTIDYPASAIPQVIAVGAMSPCAERKNPSSCDGENWWGSNYGTGLDVMAPGVLIATTDRQGAAGYSATDYTLGFNGTSSACPHAAGVAALILSANPCLTQAQVEQIMKRTARKVGSYTYSGALADGTWNNQMGFGLLDAGAAVRMASTKYLQNLTINGTATYKGWFIAAGYSVNPFITYGNFITNTGANVTINALHEIDFKTGCDLKGTVNAVITNPGSCATW
ncbi:MAG: S8 family serine peptidase [Chitinophagaceae bacterium]|nr:S8 family serine peptidase [Chitinophagaceae bacterium]